NKLAFDSHNWNHLAVALVRAGEPERAFEVLEKVILPYQHKSSRLRAKRVKNPTSPLVFDDKDTDIQITDDQLPAAHSRNRRVQMVRTNKRRLFRSEDLENATEDFIHPLFILHSISPVWSVWKPHRLTISILHRVLQHLMAGGIIRPVTRSDNS